MNRRARFQQDAVIGMAILVVILALWRLHSRPKLFGHYGPWLETNIFGASTLSLLPGAAGQGGGADPSGEPLAPITNSTAAATPGSNSPAASAANRTSGLASTAGSNGGFSTKITNTNGPATVIAVSSEDLVESPPGVSSATNVPEASNLEKRLGDAGAKGGDIQISLSWNNINDLDLHCFDPSGEEIWFSNRQARNSGGMLDVDANAHLPYTNSPVENIFFSVGATPAGLYRIYVVDYALRSTDPTPFIVRVVVQGHPYFFRSAITYTGTKEKRLICNLRYVPDNPDPDKRAQFLR